MAKRKDAFENSVNHQEVINYAIMYMIQKCEKHIEMCGSIKAAKEAFGIYFTKLRLMCEMYEIETGAQFELGGICGIELSDLY